MRRSSVPQHSSQLTPSHLHGTVGQSLGPGPFGQIVVSVVRTSRFELEPLTPHAHVGGESVELIVAVGNQVRPPVVDRTESGALAPVVQVDSHRERWPVTGLR